MQTSLTIDSGSRLHFGLLAFGSSPAYRYGGVGVMVQRPGLRLRATPAQRFGVSGPLAHRVHEFARRWQQSYQAPHLPPVHITVVCSPPQHAGLGTGTQLGLSVAALLCQWRSADGVPAAQRPPATELAAAIGRAERSTVGTFGFELGGLILEHGKQPGQTVGQLAERVALPDQWRAVIWTPTGGRGLSGSAEQRAFERIPAVPESITQQLLAIATHEMIPAAKAGDLPSFGEAVYRYGYQAGCCFAEQQGGPFASRQLEKWVAAVRSRGVTGVGQSSWGPSLFAFVASELDADRLASWFARDVADAAVVETVVTPIANQPAALRWTN